MRSNTITHIKRARWQMSAMLSVSALLLSGGVTGLAQPSAGSAAQHQTADTVDQNKQLADQVAQLRSQVAKLQAALQQAGPAKKPATNASGMKMGAGNSSGTGMGMMEGEMGMSPGSGGMGTTPTGMRGRASGRGAMPSGGMGMMEGEMGGMSSGGSTMPSGGMGMMEGEMGMSMGSPNTSSMSSAPAAAMGMCCMGEMGGMSSGGGGNTAMSGMPGTGTTTPMARTSSAMPGEPGASHLYHIGSTGFFLNHPRHITLTPDQKLTLNRLKERAMLDRASQQRRIEQAEQELYALTGADQPDEARIQAKVAEIEKLRAEQRMNFIRSVGEAAKVLTPEQSQALLGTMKSK